MYHSGLITGVVMGILSSFIIYILVTQVMGGVFQVGQGKTLLTILIASNVVMGGLIGLIVSGGVHYGANWMKRK